MCGEGVSSTDPHLLLPGQGSGGRGTGSAPHRQTDPALRKTPCWGPCFHFPPPTPCFALRLTQKCPCPEAWLPLKSVSGGETEAREWIGHSTWPQTPAQLLITLVGLPEAWGHQGPRKAPVPQKTAQGWGTAGEEEADLSAWERLSHCTAGFPPPREAAVLGGLRDLRSQSHACSPCRAPLGAFEPD